MTAARTTATSKTPDNGGGGLRKVEGSPNFPHLEQAVLEFWDQTDVYRRSLEARRDAPRFVFYEGPPTANGMPHPGHCLTRAIKDVFPRYRTMRGYRCERKAGWDTHGLPVEVEVGKELGIHRREEIIEYGEEAFIQKCQQSVFRYISHWRNLTRRLGFWVDLDDAYVTYHQSYVESVWWSLKNLFDRGLLYKGHKIVWWWAQGGTALSSGEVGEGYREVADPSVYVLFPLRAPEPLTLHGASLVVWTTTPWTLPSNTFAAVHPTDVEYVLVRDEKDDARYVMAAALVETLAGKLKRDLTVVQPVDAGELIGVEYDPPFDGFVESTGDPHGTLDGGGTQRTYWRVVGADFVTTDSGTGVVHLAPAFGEVDYEVLQRQRERFDPSDAPELLCNVGPDGRFTDAFPPAAGTWVKDADRPIADLLKASGRLLLLDQYLHDYPFCWRAPKDPLIQYPREGWFIRTTQFKDAMLENNRHIGWRPEHIRDGRFGNFLASNVDWALSRERFWGTPLPVWVCEQTGRAEAVGSYDELLDKPGVAGTDVWDRAKASDPSLCDDLRIHKPYIDAVTYDSPFAAGSTMRRVSEVIDCWYDSGAMPFAQWGYPHRGHDEFADQFPADFISEAIDQTRGWFYSQLAIATMLKDQIVDPLSERESAGSSLSEGGATFPLPFRNCIVLGLMLGEDGNKMSKKDRNYREPSEIFDKYGADALRWFFFSNQTPWTAIRYREQSIKESIPEFLLRLWNCFTFLTIYADIDGFDPSDTSRRRDVALRGELDRWIVGELHRTVRTVTERMDDYDNYAACRAINDLVDGLSNWYVRRSRDRFWASDADGGDAIAGDKIDAYWTLYETLIDVTRLIAPFTPFIAETLFRHLTESVDTLPSIPDVPDSVHLCDYPDFDAALVDDRLSASMATLREIASLGRAARAEAKLKVRLPLSKVEVVLKSDDDLDWLRSHDDLIKEELNVKAVDYTTDGRDYVEYQIVPNFRRLGPKVGRAVPELKKVLAESDGGDLMATMQSEGRIVVELSGGPVTLDADDVEIRLTARDGWAAARGQSSVVVLNTDVTDELRREGLARDLIRVIATRRKELELDYQARIRVAVDTDDGDLITAMAEHADLIRGETLCDDLTAGPVGPDATGFGDARVAVAPV